MILADKIIENRKKCGWSQEELADKLGVSRQSVSKWEGAQAVPDMKKIVQMADIFGVTTDYLLKDDIEETPETISESVEYSAGQEKPTRVSMEQANAFLAHNEKAASTISTGVMLCILSPVLLIVLPYLSEAGTLSLSQEISVMLGLIVLLIMIACGVALFVLTGIKGKPFEFLENRIIETEYGISGMVKERREAYEGTHTRLLIMGIGLCIVSAIPLFVSMMMGYMQQKQDSLFTLCGVSLLLVLVAIGVKMIVLTSVKQGGFDKLLEEGDYSRLNKKAGVWDGIYWAIITAIYFGWSFTTMRWEMTWIVWPIAGVVFAAYREVMKMIIKSKK
ncbi:MAG: helix-turn-helix transcriptional regulator [Clostridia bacterium]|nr:helix-turn-helix transcriptional regulator [Clostridia bacterium]